MGGTGTGTLLTSTSLPTSSTVSLAGMILKVAENLKNLRYGTTTSVGTVSTLIDTNLDEPDDFFNKGTVFFLSGTLQGTTAVVTDWDNTTHTLTFRTQLEAPGSGVLYAVLDAVYPREAIVAGINAALSELGPFPNIYEDAAFITVADQEEYTLPSGVYNIKKVFVATSDTAPYNYIENNGWFEENGSLHFDMDTPATADYRIMLYYETPHASVVNDTDLIMEVLHPDLLCWTAAVKAIVMRMGAAENSEPVTKEYLSYAQQKAAQMRGLHPIKHFQKASRPSGW